MASGRSRPKGIADWGIRGRADPCLPSPQQAWAGAMRISVIIPKLNEAETIGQTLARVRQAGGCQLVAVDGGSDDGTPEIARGYADVVLSAPRGRARQMNVGAQAAAGEVLVFLHADTLLPHGFPEILAQ